MVYLIKRKERRLNGFFKGSQLQACEIFDYVQQVRADMTDGDKIRYSGVEFLSSKVYCGKCGQKYGPRPWHSTTYNNLVWQCRSANGNNGRGELCGNHRVYDEVLKCLIHKLAAKLMLKRGIIERVKKLAAETQSERKAVEISEYLDRFVSGDRWDMYEDLDDLSFVMDKVKQLLIYVNDEEINESLLKPFTDETQFLWKINNFTDPTYNLMNNVQVITNVPCRS